MKFAYAWTFAGELCAATSAPPPGKRAPAMARLRACRALFRQAGERIFRAMLAVFRTGRRQRLAFGDVPAPAFHASLAGTYDRRRTGFKSACLSRRGEIAQIFVDVLAQVANPALQVEGSRNDDVASLAFFPDALFHFLQAVWGFFVMLGPQFAQNCKRIAKILRLRRRAIERRRREGCCHEHPAHAWERDIFPYSHVLPP
jgi:hypothetical protein